jgi:hypothetical protein
VLSIRQQFEKDLKHQAVVATETTRMKTELERLSKELRSVEGSLDDISFGLYKPHYKFDTPEKFKKARPSQGSAERDDPCRQCRFVPYELDDPGQHRGRREDAEAVLQASLTCI